VTTELLDLRAKAHYAVYHANRALVARGWDAQPYVEGRAALDAVLLDLAAAKWWLGIFEGTHNAFVARNEDPRIRERARNRFERVIQRADLLATHLKLGKAMQAAAFAPPTMRHEVLFFEDTPLVPTICPIVVLQGSSRDMGRQYARQVVEIYNR
jgi:hypothetical protein